MAQLKDVQALRNPTTLTIAMDSTQSTLFILL
jgi:hypothetical protein